MWNYICYLFVLLLENSIFYYINLHQAKESDLLKRKQCPSNTYQFRVSLLIPQKCRKSERTYCTEYSRPGSIMLMTSAWPKTVENIYLIINKVYVDDIMAYRIMISAYLPLK